MHVYIPGYANNRALKVLGFKTDDNNIAIFANYSDYEVGKGKIIECIKNNGISVKVKLKLKKAHLNLGANSIVDHIPKGFKSIILVSGSIDDILKVKNTLPMIGNWNESPHSYKAIFK